MEYYFDEILSCECVGEFEDEFVYDIEVDDESHTFIGNDILVHNSLYLSYQNLLSTISGIEKMDDDRKLDIVLNLNTNFLDDHNKEFMEEYYKTRFAKSVQKFELETIALCGAWINAKKKYAQILLWKDGTYYDKDDLPMKIKGIEAIKSSTSKVARQQLKDIIRYFLQLDISDKVKDVQLLNLKLQELKSSFLKADIEDVSGSCNVNTYSNYVISDDGPRPIFKPKVPYNVRGLANYNNIIKRNHFNDEVLIGGKLKYYVVKNDSRAIDEYFAFQSKNLPDWSQEFAPIDKRAMFTAQVLDPFNRILDATGYPMLEIDGNIQLSMF